MPPMMTSKEKLKDVINRQNRMIGRMMSLLKNRSDLTEDDLEKLEASVRRYREKSRALLR